MDQRIMRAVVGAALVATISGAQAAELEFNNLFVIGDSLSDEGAYSQAVQVGGGGALPAINYRFLTNALDGSSMTYAAALGQHLGIDLQPNLITGVPVAGLGPVAVGGTNYAQGGARVDNPAGIGVSLPTGINTLPLSAQVDRLLADTPRFGDDALIILWGGANDVFAQSGAVGAGALDLPTALGNMGAAAQILSDQVDRLRGAGAETIIVVTVPDIGTTPFGVSQGPAGAALLTTLSATFNNTLLGAVGDRAVIVDSARLLSTIQADPARYGFTAPDAGFVPACPGSSLQCLQGVNASADSEQRVFADGVHPTTAAHLAFGEAAFAGLQAATQVGSISVATLTALRQQSLSTDNRLNPSVLSRRDAEGNAVQREIGDVDVFASFEIGRYEADAQQVTPGIAGDTQVAKVGFDVVIAPRATLGLGLSHDRGQVRFDGDRGGFDSELLVGALFGQISLPSSFYLNAAVGGGRIDVTEFNRRFNIGAGRESYSAETDGAYRFARIGGGAMIRPSPEMLLNPFAHFTYESVSIDGFTESFGAASLSYGDTEYESRRITAGLSTTVSPARMPGWRFNLRGSLEHDLNDDPLTVSLGPDSGTLGVVSAPRPDRTYGYLSGTVIREFGVGSLLSFSASGAVGQQGATGYVASVAYKMTF